MTPDPQAWLGRAIACAAMLATGCGLIVDLHLAQPGDGGPDAELDGDADGDGDVEVDGDADVDGTGCIFVPTRCGGPSVIQDDFEDPARLPVWYEYVDGADIDEQSGQLEITPASGTDSWADYTSVFAVTLRDDRLTVEVPQMLDTESAAIGYVGLSRQDELSGISFAQEEGLLYLDLLVDGDETTETVSYDPALHRFWQIRESGGTIFWETSPDGCDWTPRREEPTPDFVSVVWIELGAGTYSEVSSPGTIAFDNINMDREPSRYCPVSTLSDDFADERIDDSWLASWQSDTSCCSFEEVDQCAQFTLMGSGSCQCEYRSATAFDLTGDSVYVWISEIHNYEPGMRVYLELEDVHERAPSLSFEDDSFVAVTADGESEQDTEYDGEPYWRIGELGGELVFDVAWDLDGPWTVVSEVPTDFDASAVSVGFGVDVTESWGYEIGVCVSSINAPP